MKRQHVEIAVASFATALAVAAMSLFIRPDLSKLPRPEAFPMRPEAEFAGVAPLAPPKVAPDFAAAVALDKLALMQKLYKKGMPLDDMLSTAAQLGERDVAEWLLDHGADVHEGEDTPHAPVLMADAYPDVVSLLYARGAQEPTIYAAADAGAANAVARLLDEHVPADSEALAAAVRSERMTDPAKIALIDVLVKHGAKNSEDTILATVNIDDEPIEDAVFAAPFLPGATATALAEMDVPPRALQKLAKHGIDWAWHDGEDDAAMPLVAVVRRQNREAARLMIAAGAPVDRHFKNGDSALGVALDALRDDDAESARIVELLLEHGANVNRRLPDGRTPLYAAAETGNVRAIDALLDRGASLNERILTDTALDIAERNDHIPAARVIHSRGGENGAPTWSGR